MDPQAMIDGVVPDEDKKKKVKPGTFQGLGLGQATYKAVMRMGYKMPTPIQRKTIPAIIEGQDMVAMARTGSGKTAAFLLPTIERLGTHSVAVGVRAVVLSPTRELAMQTAKFFKQLTKFNDLRCCLLVGGQAMETQFEHLASNPDVVIATPGRLVHHIAEAELSLSRVLMLVLDEADRLFELGFAEQMQKVIDGCPLGRQILLFSATLPAQLVSFARSGIKNPTFIRLDVETTLSENLKLQFCYCRKDEKLAAAIAMLRRLHQGDQNTIMFVATKHHVEFFGDLLREMDFPVSCVYGAMDQACREEQVKDFRTKKSRIMITTDVAARGIDIPMLDNVLNFDFPPSSKLFVHRAGRTARAGRSGLAVSLVTLEDLPYTVELTLFLGVKLTVPGSPEWKEDPTAPVLGAVPSLEHEVEQLQMMLKEKDTALHSLHKSMMLSYKVYNKMRPAASKFSVGRSKRLLEQAGGPTRLQGLIHPDLLTGDEGVAFAAPIATADRDFVQELRGFRPSAEAKQGNVLSQNVMRNMSQCKKESNIVKTTKAEFRQQDAEEEEEANKRKRKRRRQEVEAEPLEIKERGPRMSKSQRKGGKVTNNDGLAEDFADFDISVDGVGLDDQKKDASKKKSAGKEKEPAEEFYLSVERDMKADAKERGLEMEQYQVDLVPDEDRDLQKAKSVMRWDARKKKYLPTMVTADGRAVKRQNEAGARVKGEAENTGIYGKWAKSTKKRIPKVGEMETGILPLGKFRPNQEETKSVSFGDYGDVLTPDDAGGEGDKKRKPVVPFHGAIEEKYLTHKQKRMLKKRSDKDSGKVRSGSGGEKLKTADQMRQDRKDRENAKLKQKPHLRKKKAADMKATLMKKREEKQMQKGGTKSKILVFKDNKWHGKKKTPKNGFLHRSI